MLRGNRRITDDVEFSRIEEKDIVELSNKNYNKVLEIVNKIYDENIQTDSTECWDVWEINFLYKDKNIRQPRYMRTSPELLNLYNFHIELSPIEVDIYSLA